MDLQRMCIVENKSSSTCSLRASTKEKRGPNAYLKESRSKYAPVCTAEGANEGAERSEDGTHVFEAICRESGWSFGRYRSTSSETTFIARSGQWELGWRYAVQFFVVIYTQYSLLGIIVHDIPERKRLVQISDAHKGKVSGLCWAEGDRLLSCGVDRNVKLWDTRTLSDANGDMDVDAGPSEVGCNSLALTSSSICDRKGCL